MPRKAKSPPKQKELPIGPDTVVLELRIVKPGTLLPLTVASAVMTALQEANWYGPVLRTAQITVKYPKPT